MKLKGTKGVEVLLKAEEWKDIHEDPEEVGISRCHRENYFVYKREKKKGGKREERHQKAPRWTDHVTQLRCWQGTVMKKITIGACKLGRAESLQAGGFAGRRSVLFFAWINSFIQ